MRVIGGAVMAAALLCSSSPAAQGPIRSGPGFPPAGLGFGRGVDILRVEPLEWSPPVIGVPFSADTVTEVTQQLADGNRVEQRLTGTIARAANGRIRLERTLAGFGSATSPRADVRIVTISSPADRVQYRLDEPRKIAWRLRLPPPPPSGAFAGRSAGPPRPGLKTEQLAPIQFEGVRAEGTRTILVLPAGSIGNERIIETVSERWYSPDLQVVVHTRRVDPRYGEVTYRLLNIVRTEPAPFLFEVPADFTLSEQRPFWPEPPASGGR